jgi:hypothetical protein
LNDLNVNKESSDNKPSSLRVFPSEEVMQILREHKAALQILSGHKSLLAKYRKKLLEMDLI